jgi:hypothetical protein
MTEFTPVEALIGGGLIGLAAAGLMLLLGHIAGISGITEELLPPWEEGEDQRWRAGFVLGIVLAPLAYAGLTGALPLVEVRISGPMMALAGLLVGLGTSFGRGCTSGHGVCGLARLSRRSMVAVAVFLSVGILTAGVTRHWIGV